MASEEPPLNFQNEQGGITGISADVVKEIQRRVGNSEPIGIYPWTRVFNISKAQPNIVAFTMARTPEREEHFHWITQINRNAWILFALKDSSIEISNLREAKRVKSIGVVHGDAREQLLWNLGFKNLEYEAEYEQNIKKLSAGRLSLMFYSPTGLVRSSKEIGIDPTQFKPVFSVRQSQAYIVMSKETDATLVAQWTLAASEIKEDGTFEAIAKKWMAYLKETDGLETHYHDGALNLWPEQF